MKIVILHKEPITERIPNLKAFIVYASSLGNEVVLITTTNPTYPEPTFLNENITYLTVEERSRRLQLPTFIRFYAFCLFFLVRKIFQRYSLVLAGKYAIIFGSAINFIRLKKFCSFIIEYPEFPSDGRKLSLADIFELNGIRKSQFIITHDKLHADFIADKMQIKNIKFATVPNGTVGPSNKKESKFLHERFNLNMEKKILLHSGGFGAWFESSELAARSELIPEEYSLIFHISHDITKDGYYKEYLRHKKIGDHSLLSLIPVSTNRLDELVSSAYIGIAWYSKSVLGYRATMLGLAAGKIGNYLKCGIPVIVPAYESFCYISEYMCGEQISDLDGLNKAICKINSNYSQYSKNALKCYDKLWSTEMHCKNLLQELVLCESKNFF